MDELTKLLLRIDDETEREPDWRARAEAQSRPLDPTLAAALCGDEQDPFAQHREESQFPELAVLRKRMESDDGDQILAKRHSGSTPAARTEKLGNIVSEYDGAGGLLRMYDVRHVKNPAIAFAR